MRFRFLFILLALIALLIGYYWIHKPFDVGSAQTFIGFGLDLLPMAFLAVCAGSIGRWILNRLGFTLESRAERVALDILLGLGAIAELALIAGLLGAFTPLILWSIVFFLGVFALFATRGSWLLDCRSIVNRAIHPATPWVRFLAWFTLFMFATSLIVALAPPIAWDALAYHLVGVQRYLASGRIAVQPDNPYLGFPQNVEMLYGLAVGLFGRYTAAAPIHWMFGVFAFIATAGLIRRRLGVKNETTGWVAIAILISAFSIWELLGWPYIDLAMMAYGAAVLIALGYWQESRQPKWLILIGIYLGLALGVKLTGAALLVAAGVYIVAHTLRRGPRTIVKTGIILAAAALLTYTPWLIKGALLYHNPIYPYLFGGVGWDIQRGLRFNELNNVNDGLLGSPWAWQWPFLPISATIFGASEGDANNVLYGFTTGPWLLTLPFILLFSWRWLRSDTKARHLALDCLLLTLPLLVCWWIIAGFSNIGVQTRLMITGFPAVAVLGELAFQSLRNSPLRSPDLFFIFRAVLVLSLVLEGFQVVQYGMSREIFPYATATTDRDSFLGVPLGPYYEAMQHLDNLPPGAHVRFLFEPRGYYCPVSLICEADVMLDNWQEGLDQHNTPDQIFADWRQAKDAYLLLYNSAFDYYQSESRTSAGTAQFAATQSHWLTPIWSNGDYTLYTWKTF